MPEKNDDNINRTAREFYQKGLAALERNNLDYTIEMFLQCLAIEPNFLKARNYLRAAQMKRAESAGGFKRMLISAKTSPLLTKAKLAVSKNPAEAMVLAEQILSEDPKNGQALTILAEAAETAGYPETTVQTLEHVTKLSPRDTKSLHWLARSYGAVERWDMARDVYEKLLQINPSDFDAQKGIKDATAHGAMQSGGWEENPQSFRDVLKDKDESIALEQQSRVVRAADMTENLIRDTLDKLSRDKDNRVLQRELGRLYAQKGEFDKALEILETIYAAEAGSDPSLEKELADIKAKRIQTAIDKLKEQLAAHPENAAALQKDIASLEQEHALLQVKQAEELVERYPNDLTYRYDLGVLYMNVGNIEEAIKQLQKAVGQPQKRIAALNYLGQCFSKVGLHDFAVDQYAKAIEELPVMDNMKKDLLYNLGTEYEILGDQENAVAEFKKIAAVDFGYRDVKDKIIRRPPPKPA